MPESELALRGHRRDTLAGKMSAPTIRPASPSDREAIGELLEQLGYPAEVHEVEKRLKAYGGGAAGVLVAELDNEIVGFASFLALPLFHADEMLGRITAMCVRADCRRKGIGRNLLEQIQALAATMGCQRIEVTSGDHRADEAHRFYEGCGYVASSRRFQLAINSQTK